jgi:hypothetical protein
MTAQDRTEQLVVEMLARRAGGAPPADLLERTMRTVAATPQARVAGHHPPASRRRPRAALLLAAGMMIAIPVLLSVLVAAGLAVRAPESGPGAAAGASLDPTVSPGPAAGEASPADTDRTPPTTGASPDPALAPGSLAVVTVEGKSLRVRSRPTTDNSKSKKYTPLLPPGTRMLIVGGPVVADGMTWYEVQTDAELELIDLFGWVSTGQNGETWIEPRTPRCPERVDASTVATLTRVEFLACYGNTRVQVQAKVADLWGPPRPGPSCGWVRTRAGTECSVDNRWLEFPDATVTLVTDKGRLHQVALALPPDMAAKLLTVPRQATSVLTISMDAPESAACRIRNSATGKDLVPANRAVTRCRLQFVIQEVRVQRPGSGASESPAP